MSDRQTLDRLKEKAHGGGDDILTVILATANDRADALRGLDAMMGDLRKAINDHYDEQRVLLEEHGTPPEQAP